MAAQPKRTRTEDPDPGDDSTAAAERAELLRLLAKRTFPDLSKLREPQPER